MKRCMYEILVPCQYNDGKPVRTKHHKEWDKVVRSITGGLTVFKPVKGQWLSSDSELFEERMIPVRIACTKIQIEKIMKFSLSHYRQLAILAYLVSEEVLYLEA